MRAEAATVCGDEWPPARSGTSTALEKQGTRAEEDLGASTKVFLRDERDTGVGGGQAGIKNKYGIHVVASVHEHATCPSTRLRSAYLNSGRQWVAYDDSCP